MRLHKHPDVERLTEKKDVNGLLKCLRTLNNDNLQARGWRLRADAATGLGKLGDSRAIQPLIAALHDDYEDVRAASAGALGRLRDPAAIDAIGKMINDQVDSASLARRSDDPQPDVQEGLRALASIGGASVQELEQILHSRRPTVRDNPALRAQAVEALGEIGDATAVVALTAELQDPDAAVREAAAGALDQAGWHPAADETGAAYWVARRQWEKCSTATATKALAAVLNDRDDAVKVEARTTLVGIGVAAVPVLVECLASSDWPHPYFGDAAREVLIRIGAPAAQPLLACVLTGASVVDGSRDARHIIIEALGGIGGALVVDPLLDLLADPEPSVRAASVRALGRIHNDRAVEPLVRMLTDPAQPVRTAAVGVLARWGDQRAVSPIVALLEDHDPCVRRDAAYALDELGWVPPGKSPAAIAYWIVRGDWDKCVHAGAVVPLIHALGSPWREDREGAADALGRLGDARALRPLIEVLNNDEEPIEVCKAAARALVAMYHSGRLTEDQKQTILEQRDAITFEEDPPQWYGGQGREDRTIGVAFPL